MHSVNHITVSLGAAGLLVLAALAALVAVGPPPVARAEGDVIKVPVDHPTIQEAVNAASDGDTIRVAEGTYTERVTVTKGITLSGGWNEDYSEQTSARSVIDAEYSGRAISITCATSDTLVAISGFDIRNGDASGLGASAAPQSTGSVSLPIDGASASQTTLPEDLALLESALRATLDSVAELELFPGGTHAHQATLDRLELHSARRPSRRVRLGTALSPVTPSQGPGESLGTGGGVYSWNASLHLSDCNLTHNVANTTGDGYGGAVYVGQAAPGGTRIADNRFYDNVGSAAGTGGGGALFAINAPGAVVEESLFYNNVAALDGIGVGGGAYAYDSSDLVFESNTFLQNLATDGGSYEDDGAGGGLALDVAPRAVVRGNKFDGNAAAGAWNLGGGVGGGLLLNAADGSTITDNVIRDNLGALRGTGMGGGIQLQRTADAIVEDNEIVGNWAMMFQPPVSDAGGGGIGLADVARTTVHRNTISENIGAMQQGDGSEAFGGGISASKVTEGTSFVANTISANTAAFGGATGTSIGFGGGAAIGDSHDVVVAGNTVFDNAGGMGGAVGLAGGLHLRNVQGSQVVGNSIERNLAGASMHNLGGGLMIDSFFGVGSDATVDSNTILDNRASPDPSSSRFGGVAMSMLAGDSKVTNNVIARNQAGTAGGLALEGVQRVEVANNTLAANTDAGVFFDANRVVPEPHITLSNNIVVSHTVGVFASEWLTTPAKVSYTLWHGNKDDTGGTGTVNYDDAVYGAPVFADVETGNFRLSFESAAVDSGDPAGVPPAPEKDADGVDRPQGARVDIGAFEWQGQLSRLYMPLASKPAVMRTGWAIGQDEHGTGVILHTADSGSTWTVQGDSTAWSGLGATDVSAVDDQTAWVALGGSLDEDGAILHTADGGATWTRQPIPAGLAGGVMGVRGLSREEAWAASLNGVVLHTTDGGDTWNVVPHPGVPITVVNRIDAMGDDVWIADPSATGAIVHSADGGDKWRIERMPGDQPMTVHAASQQVVWASGQHRVAFYRSASGGDRWERVITMGGYDHLDDICAVGADSVWGVQNGDSISGDIWRAYVAADGSSWAKKVTPPELDNYMPGGVTCVGMHEAWVVATVGIYGTDDMPRGVILHTTDGEHWMQQPAPADVGFWKVSFVGARR